MHSLRQRVLHVENVIHHQLVAHSVAVLRIAVGAVFLGFGALKFFPGVSPAENLTQATVNLLSFGVVSDGVGLVAVATLECFVGLCLIFARFMRLAIWLLTVQFAGILAPLVLLPGRLFAGPHGAPTLEGQYVLKDVILVAAGMVIAAVTFRGGRLIRGDLSPRTAYRDDEPLDGDQRLDLILEGAGDPRRFAELSRRHGISESQLHDWREIARSGATSALSEHAAHTEDRRQDALAESRRCVSRRRRSRGRGPW